MVGLKTDGSRNLHHPVAGTVQGVVPTNGYDVLVLWGTSCLLLVSGATLVLSVLTTTRCGSSSRIRHPEHFSPLFGVLIVLFTLYKGLEFETLDAEGIRVLLEQKEELPDDLPF